MCKCSQGEPFSLAISGKKRKKLFSVHVIWTQPFNVAAAIPPIHCNEPADKGAQWSSNNGRKSFIFVNESGSFFLKRKKKQRKENALEGKQSLVVFEE